MTAPAVNGHHPQAANGPQGPGLFQRIEYGPGGTPGHPYLTNVRVAGTDRPAGTLLLAAASGLLLLLAAAQGYVSWRAQYTFAQQQRHAHLASALEALGLDTAAVIFAHGALYG